MILLLLCIGYGFMTGIAGITYKTPAYWIGQVFLVAAYCLGRARL